MKSWRSTIWLPFIVAIVCTPPPANTAGEAGVCPNAHKCNLPSLAELQATVPWNGVVPTPENTIGRDIRTVALGGTPVPSKFEDGTMNGWDVQRLFYPYSGKIVEDPLHPERSVGRFEIRRGAYVPHVTGFRAEVKDPYSPRAREELWYRVNTLIPEDYPIGTQDSFVIHQWLNSKDYNRPRENWRPHLSTRYRFGRLDIVMRRVRNGVQEQVRLYSQKDFPRGRWHDFVFHVRWSADYSGFVEVWLDGKQIVRYFGPVGYDNLEGPFFKCGLYSWKNVETTYVIYHGGYTRSHWPLRPFSRDRNDEI